MNKNPNFSYLSPYDDGKKSSDRLRIESIITKILNIEYNTKSDNLILSNNYYDSIKEILLIEKNTLFRSYIHQFRSILSTNFSSNGVSVGISQGAGLITMETLPQFVYPIVEYIHAYQPDCIVASDRGARFIGLAVKLLYQRLYGRLPTFDGTVRFRKVSRKAPLPHNIKMLSGIIHETRQKGKHGRILFLDDWIASGGTQELVTRLVRELGGGGIDLKYGVLVGGGGDVSGKQSSGGIGFIGAVDWHDDSDKIGVDYDDNIEPYVVGSERSIDYRDRLVRGTDKFLESLRTGSKKSKKHDDIFDRELVFE